MIYLNIKQIFFFEISNKYTINLYFNIYFYSPNNIF